MSNTTPVSSGPAPGGWSGGPPGPRGAWRTLHDVPGPCTGGLEPVPLGGSWSTTPMPPGTFRTSSRARQDPVTGHAWDRCGSCSVGPRTQRGVVAELPRPRATRVPGPPTGGWSSGDAGGAELDAHPRADGLGRLGDAVLPGALAGTAHDDQVAVPQGEPETLPAAGRAEEQRSRR